MDDDGGFVINVASVDLVGAPPFPTDPIKVLLTATTGDKVVLVLPQEAFAKLSDGCRLADQAMAALAKSSGRHQ